MPICAKCLNQVRYRDMYFFGKGQMSTVCKRCHRNRLKLEKINRNIGKTTVIEKSITGKPFPLSENPIQ